VQRNEQEEEDARRRRNRDCFGADCGMRLMTGRKRTLGMTGSGEAQDALRASEERYRILVESQSEMLCRFRRDGEILFVNGAYARARDTTAEELTGTNFWAFVPEDERSMVEAMLDRLTPESPEVRIENRFQTTEGERWVLWTNRGLVFDEAGHLVEAQSAGIDITRRKEMEEALKESDRRKDEFLATLAHELRNPLAPIGNAVEILKRADADPDLRRRAREAIERQLTHLVRLVDDLLDVSRISRDKLELRKSRVDLNSIVGQSADFAPAERESRDIAVVLPEEPVLLEADPVRLTQIFNNLLNNACKYTDHGGRIRLKVERLGREAVVTVTDDGIGVPTDQLEFIFGMFAQVQKTNAPRSGGLGVGLTLVRRLVELHGGTITARSEGVGHGSEFVVRLPLATTMPPADEEIRQALPAPESRRILIVDDNKDSADSLSLLLSLHGHETRSAYDGFAAVREAEQFRPQVILLDRGLPLLDGTEACRRIRAQPWGRDIVIVALTGWGQEADRRKSQEAGFDDHLVKPVETSVLFRLLAELPATGP
jgi:PAS domain S-box-containing protein